MCPKALGDTPLKKGEKKEGTIDPLTFGKIPTQRLARQKRKVGGR